MSELINFLDNFAYLVQRGRHEHLASPVVE